MALSTRELFLVLRARDEATRVLRGLSAGFTELDGASMHAARNQMTAGASLTTLGVGIAAAGVAVLDWMAESVTMAVEFDKQIAKVKTQTDSVAVSQKELGDISKRVAGEVGMPLAELNDGLYDIYSSMDVTVKQSEQLLSAFAKEAVAGQTSVQDASRATIGLMNAFHIPVEKVNDVLDLQFQLVRKGVGTFAEFAAATGKVTPSATRAGQSIQTMAGMLAYMTRNGMTAQQASASAARAFDALSNPKVVGRLEDMGVKVKNSAGEFLQMGDIMTGLQGKLEKLTAPQRAEALAALFKGAGGTIQARRFYDLVVKDAASAKQFVGLVGDMNNASGAFTDAYGTMADTAASKSQVLKNQWEIIRIEVGQALMPVLGVLMNVLSSVLKWWNSLSDGTKNTIVWIVAAGAALAVVVGVLIAVAGAIMMFSGAAAALGIGLGALAAIAAGVVVAIAAIIAIGWLIVANWDVIKAKCIEIWGGIVDVFNTVVDWIQKNFGDRLSAIWNKMSSDVVGAWKAVRDWAVEIWTDIVDWAAKIWPEIMKVIQPVIDWLIGIWDNVKNILTATLSILIDTFSAAWDIIVIVLKNAWEMISGVISGLIDIFQGIIDFIVGLFTGNWQLAWDGIKQIFSGVWEVITSIVVNAWQMIFDTVQRVGQWLRDIIGEIWTVIKNTFQIGVETIVGAWNWALDLILNVLKALKDAVMVAVNAIVDSFNYWKGKFTEANNWIGQKIREIGQWFSDLPGVIGRALSNAGTWLVNTGKDLLTGLWNGIVNAKNWLLQKVGDFFGNLLPDWVEKMLGINSPSKVFAAMGKMTSYGFADGMMAGLGNVKDAANALGDAAVPNDISGMTVNADGTISYNGGAAPGGGTYGIPPENLAGAGGKGSGVVVQNISIYTSQIDPEANAADLGFALGRGVG